MPPYSELDAHMLYLLHRAVQVADFAFEQALGNDGVTPRQAVVMLAVSVDPGASQTSLCDATGIDRSTMAEIIRRLLKAGLLQRTNSAKDSRAYEVRLTAAGERALDRARAAMELADKTVLAAVSGAKRPGFVNALKVIAGNDASRGHLSRRRLRA